MEALDKFEIVKCGPYRFVGKSVYIGNKRGTPPYFDFMWAQSDWVFEELDKMQDYASDIPYNAALITWDKYDDKSELFGYYIGRFMKADTPVTKEIDLDYFDIPEGEIAQAWMKGTPGKRGGIFSDNDVLVDEAIKRADYNGQHWKWSADICLIQEGSDETNVGSFIPCKALTKKELKKRTKTK